MLGRLRSSQTQKFMMTELIPGIKKVYPTPPSILHKYTQYEKKNYFQGSGKEEFDVEWRLSFV